jgi:hypothetical protein
MRIHLLSLALVAGCELYFSDTPVEQTFGVPISGGTMLVTRDGRRAVIADPDRDRVVVVDLDTKTTQVVPLEPGDEPGRLVEDGGGRVHIALRSGGGVATVTTDGSVLRRAVCPEPRGLAWDAAIDAIHVACATGELVTMPADGGEPSRVLHLDRDLRDVVVAGDQLVVTRFRSAEVLTIDRDGMISSRTRPAIQQRPVNGMQVDAIPSVAWRTIALPDGRILMSHQLQVDAPLRIVQGGYGNPGPSGCARAQSAASVFQPGADAGNPQPYVSGALPVDVAVNSKGDTLAFLTAGSDRVAFVKTTTLGMSQTCKLSFVNNSFDPWGMPTSVAFAGNDDLLEYYPEVPVLVVRRSGAFNSPTTIALPGPSGMSMWGNASDSDRQGDPGRQLFHRETPSGLACASCHPEGRDDGRVWKFADLGSRRTQSLAGHVLARAPFHWTGDQRDMSALVTDVFSQRMGGVPEPSYVEVSALGRWLDRVPAPAAPVPSDPDAVMRGKVLFESADVGCTACHAGSLRTNNAVVDVGTGGKFKVPSLVGVGARAPYLHDGRAATLLDRFSPSGGDRHGNTSILNAWQLADLIAYLETL